ncbi:MAG: DUF3800 domain-containing protein [Chlorobium sp.]|uniref:DUF3800 domain-containing protein n=1 Tax=Chlorobium sp. TaxID=1095 RepID=UPI002F4226E6
MKIYLDESGHTGADLLCKDQPFFAIAACWMDDCDYYEIRDKIFNGVQSEELKFKSIKKRKKPVGLERFIQFISEKSDRYCVYLVDKKSILIEKFVLDCIEPAYAEMGLDISKEGGIRAYANLLNICLPSYMGMGWYNQFLKLYQNLIRQKDKQSILDLHKHSSSVKPEAEEFLRPFLMMPQLSIEEVRCQGYRSEIYDVILLGLLVHIRNAFKIKNFEIRYDNTKATTDIALGELLKGLQSYDRKVVVSKACIVYPDINIVDVRSCDSKIEPVIQIADLIAGLFVYATKPSKVGGPLFRQLIDTISDKNIICKNCTADVTPEQLGTRGADGCITVHSEQIKKKG